MPEYFDLNIDKVLEHWSIPFAIREFISNALDEQILTKTNDVEIFKLLNVWHIRDYGRGIQMKHFSQNENEEKLKAKNIIGKFGVGLKDALAVLDRNQIKVNIVSKYCNVTIEKHPKSNFNLETLHAVFNDDIDHDFVGTDVRLFNIDDSLIEEAKSLFLHFSSKSILDSSKYGEVHLCNGKPKIYVNGLQVAEEENFLFSYNITNINTVLKRALNRERSNVGRVAYSDSVKLILLNSKSQNVLDRLVKDLMNFTSGSQKDESGWLDVAIYAAKTLDKTNKYMFVSAYEPLDTNQREIAKTSGREIVLIPDNIYQKLESHIYTFNNAVDEYNDSFEFEPIDLDKLTNIEKKHYQYIDMIRKFYRDNTDLRSLPNVTIVKKLSLTINAKGLWDGEQIWIERSALKDLREFIECVIHEYAHSINDNYDNTREFESDLGKVFSYFPLVMFNN